ANAVAFSPDGKWVASGSGIGVIRIWETGTGKELRHFGSGDQGKVNAVAFSPDGTLLASANSDKSVRLWEVRTGNEVRRLTGHGAQVYAVAFSPQGTTLAAGSEGLRLWEVASGKLQAQLGGKWTVTAVAFTPDGQRLVSADSDAMTRLWDLATAKEQQTGARPPPPAGGEALSPRGANPAPGGAGSTPPVRERGHG